MSRMIEHEIPLKDGDSVESLYPETRGQSGVIVKANHRKASKNAEPGFLCRVKFDKSKKTRTYHEGWLRKVTPLERLL